MARKNRTPEETARREKIRELLRLANIGSIYSTDTRRDFCVFPLYKRRIICYNTRALRVYAPVAQWIEHRIPVPRVGGSSPFWRTTASVLIGFDIL